MTTRGGWKRAVILGFALLASACGGHESAAGASGGAPGTGSGGATGLPAGAACNLNSDCEGQLLCLYGECYVQCREARDCSAEQRCVKVSDAGVCKLATDATCHFNSDCPRPLVCAPDQQCRNQCILDRDCVVGEVCSQGICAVR